MGEGRWNRGLRVTMPLVVAGAMTITMNLTGPLEPASAAAKKPAKPKLGLEKSHAAANAKRVVAATHTGTLPASHTVLAGDTVSTIAQHYGVSTASLLAINGLGWKSLIFPGQVLKLTSANGTSTPVTNVTEAVAAGRYTIQKGDTVTRVAARFGVSTQAILTANGLGWSSIIYPGQTIAIPGTDLAVAPVVDESLDPPSTPPVTTPPVAATHTIVSGDTVSGIAQRYGVTTASVLAANGLTPSTVIYPGQTLAIPGSMTLASSVTAASAGGPTIGSITPLDTESTANAAIIVAIGRELGVPDRGIVIALAAAMQESSMSNIAYGDRDSLGLFQQRPSSGWGSPDQILNASHAARLFYGGPLNPNKGHTRGLLEIPGWQSMSVTQAAQAVQISAYPDAYAKWEASAWDWLAALG